MKFYWVPVYKYQYLEWFKNNRKNWDHGKLKTKSLKQLRAIYFSTRDKFLSKGDNEKI